MIQDLFNYINQNNFIGIPMDIIAHFLVGMVFIVGGLVLKVRFGTLLVLLFILASVKEISDIISYGSPISENLKDYFFSFLYPLILTPIRILKKGNNWIN